MSCDFTLAHYGEILKVALDHGYRFSFFQEQIQSNRVIYLRHDIDICLEEAVEMASLEAELGVSSTYFVLVNSPVYNLLAKENLEILDFIRSKGHQIGLHIDPNMFKMNNVDELELNILDMINFVSQWTSIVPVISFHRPIPWVLNKDFRSFASVYSSLFFSRIKYVSDSRGVWREGCPCHMLSEGKYPVLQILVHPIWWKRDSNETVDDFLNLLLSGQLGKFKRYLGDNIEPFKQLFAEGSC